MASRLDQARTYISAADEMGGFAESFVAGAGGLVMAFFAIIIGLGEAFANLVISPVDSFAFVTSASIEAIFGGPAGFIQSAWNAAAVSLGMDPWMNLGPFIIFVASVAFITGIAPILWYLDVIDADTITGLNLPVIELDTGGDLDDED